MKYFIGYKSALKVLLTALALFLFFRLLFLFFNIHSYPANPDFPAYLFFRSFLYGLNFDIVICCYVLAPYIIFCFIQQLSEQSLQGGVHFFKWYFILIFSVLLLICAADIPYYKQFSARFSKEAFSWASSPGFMFSLIFSSFSYWGFLIPLLLCCFVVYKCSNVIFSKIYPLVKHLNKLLVVITFLFIGFITLIGMRGRIAFKSPIRTGTAFFSEYTFFNQLGLNPCFVFFKSLKHAQQWEFMNKECTKEECKRIINSIAAAPHSVSNTIERIYTGDSTGQKYNVILVLMESMSMSKMGYHQGKHLTKHFDSIARSGIFFNQFYSSGIHTFNGLFSTQTGFPSIMNLHPLNNYIHQPFKGLSYWLKKYGYSTNFFTCHDGEFDNMKGFMKLNYFDNFYSEDDYPYNKVVSTLGVPDHYMYEFALSKIDKDFFRKS